jgi:hypothetical protein
MTAVTRPRGPLPARVYWTRRLVVVVVALALVVGIARLLGGTAGDPGPSASPVAADQSPSGSSAPSAPSSSSPSSPSAVPPTVPPGSTAVARPARPNGTCNNDDIVATPGVRSPAYAGRPPVVLTATLRTRQALACSWTVSPGSLVVKVTSGADRIWSTQDCPGALPRRVLVVRRDTPVTVDIRWDGLRSDATCSHSTAWAGTGYYHVVAAAFGAEPVDTQFRLSSPPPQTETATPTPTDTPSPGARAAATPSAAPARTPAARTSSAGSR